MKIHVIIELFYAVYENDIFSLLLKELFTFLKLFIPYSIQKLETRFFFSLT